MVSICCAVLKVLVEYEDHKRTRKIDPKDLPSDLKFIVCVAWLVVVAIFVTYVAMVFRLVLCLYSIHFYAHFSDLFIYFLAFWPWILVARGVPAITAMEVWFHLAARPLLVS